jgi:hypothetical protein
VVVVLVSLAGPTGALAGTGSAADTSAACARPVLGDPSGGSEAIRELGTDLAATARSLDKTPTEFRALLREDSTVQVDECGAAFVVEPELSAPATENAGEDATDESAEPSAAPGGLDATGDAFTLSSRPGSARTIYLDFTGERIVGTGWNTSANVADFTAPPYDLDGSPSSFNAAERDIVRGVWLRVAEDYAPFDVNVTTADPGAESITRTGSSDQVYGTRALITPDPVVYTNVCQQSCGGIAYLNAFNRTSGHAVTQPALIFSQALQPTAKSIAEAVAHEVGHNLGLNHDDKGSSSYYAGHTPWAPIMGVGYYQPVSQWSNGEYGGNNTENDVDVIAAHGAPIVADDYPGTLGAAAPLPANTAVDGVIATRADVDSFAFTVPVGAETTTVIANPASVGADLDIRLSLYDHAGTLVATADPPPVRTNAEAASGLDARLNLALSPGTYVATVDGAGWSTAVAGYTDYASLGRYTIGVAGFSDPLVVTAGSLPPAVAPAPDFSVPLQAPVAAPVAAPTQHPRPSAVLPDVLRASLRTAVSGLKVHAESGTRFRASRFPLVDANRDCQSTRVEVLLAESLQRPQSTRPTGCTVRAGKWFSSFDRRTVTSGQKVTAEYAVPLAEAWSSGARSWPPARRRAYANDLGDRRTLLAVSTSSATARGAKEPTSWLPAPASRCSYVASWVAVKVRWGLTVDAAEKRRLVSLAAGCANVTLTVHRV